MQEPHAVLAGDEDLGGRAMRAAADAPRVAGRIVLRPVAHLQRQEGDGPGGLARPRGEEACQLRDIRREQLGVLAREGEGRAASAAGAGS